MKLLFYHFEGNRRLGQMEKISDPHKTEKN